MKRRSVKRGLYRRETWQTETPDELFEALERLSGDLDRYLDECAQLAGDILRRAEIDPDTLHDIVTIPGKHIAGAAVRYSTIDRDALDLAVGQALEVCLAVRSIRESEDLGAKATRNALWRGIGLAQNIEHLKANLAWERPVSGYVNSRRRSAYLEHVRDAARQCKAEGVKPTATEITRRLNLAGCPVSYSQTRVLLRRIR